MQRDDFDCSISRNDGPVIRGGRRAATKGEQSTRDTDARSAPEAPLHRCTLHVLRARAGLASIVPAIEGIGDRDAYNYGGTVLHFTRHTPCDRVTQPTRPVSYAPCLASHGHPPYMSFDFRLRATTRHVSSHQTVDVACELVEIQNMSFTFRVAIIVNRVWLAWFDFDERIVLFYKWGCLLFYIWSVERKDFLKSRLKNDLIRLRMAVKINFFANKLTFRGIICGYGVI